MNPNELLLRVYDLFLSEPITSAFRMDAQDGPDGESPEQDEELLVAIQADRFMLMQKVRQLQREPQLTLPLSEGVA